MELELSVYGRGVKLDNGGAGIMVGFTHATAVAADRQSTPSPQSRIDHGAQLRMSSPNLLNAASARDDMLSAH
jgi:hypothetical protein